MAFRIVIIGGTGQVGAAVVRALVAEPACTELVTVNRRVVGASTDPKVREVVLDTGSPDFSEAIASLAASLVDKGEPVVGISCVGVGSGSLKWSEDELKALEVGIVGGFARGCLAGSIQHFCLLSAVGSSSKSRFRYVRVMGLKEEAIEAVGFRRLAIFRPGIIAGNVHTPGYVAFLGRLVPGGFGTVEQDDMARAFVAECLAGTGKGGVAFYENGDMRRLSRQG